MKRFLSVLAIALSLFTSVAAFAGAATDDLDLGRALFADELAAMQTVETGGERDPAHATSNNGRDNGWYQISRVYFEDAKDSPLGKKVDWPTYERVVASREWSERAVVAYWSMWSTMKAGAEADENRARVHNGGPRGAKKSSTAAYWRKVQRAMREAKARK